MSWTRADQDELFRRVQNMVVRGTVSKVADSPKMQELDLALEHEMTATKVEHWHPYGISYHPNEGAEVLALALGGNRDHMVVVATADRRYRVKVEKGEFAIHDDQGQKVHFKRDGVLVETGKKVTVTAAEKIQIESQQPIEIKSPQGLTLDAPTITVKGNIQQQGSITSSGVHAAAGHV